MQYEKSADNSALQNEKQQYKFEAFNFSYCKITKFENLLFYDLLFYRFISLCERFKERKKKEKIDVKIISLNFLQFM